MQRPAVQRRRQIARVYFMRCSHCDLIKIGVSGNYRLRRLEVERQIGHRVDVLAVLDGGYWAEARLHRQFAADWVEREWYRPSARLLAYIEGQGAVAGGKG